MPSPKKSPNELNYEERWEIVMDALADIQRYMQIRKTSKSYLKLEYGGSLGALKIACTRILNVIDSISDAKDKQDKKEYEARLKEIREEKRRGLDSEDRRKEVLDSASGARHWSRSRTVKD